MPAGWIKLATFGSGFEADMVRARPEEADIPVQLRGQQPGAFGPSFQGPVPGGIDLYVPSPEVEHARELLDRTA
jgi:hypothetical protein